LQARVLFCDVPVNLFATISNILLDNAKSREEVLACDHTID